MIRNKENDLKAYRFILKFGWTPVKALSTRVFPGMPLDDLSWILRSLVNLGVIIKEQGSYFAIEGGEEIIERASLSIADRIRRVSTDLDNGTITTDVAMAEILKIRNHK